jgi:hypothetical protein
MNGHWDVTETKEFLEGIRGPGRGALKRLFIPSNTQGYTCLLETSLMCIRKLRDAALLYKAHEGHERRYLYRAEYYNPMFCFWVIMFILKSLCTMTTVTQWKVLKQGVHCILLLIDIFLICFERV